MKTRLILSAVVFMALTAVVTAQTTQQDPAQTGKGREAGNAWVDANNDGVCDNFVAGTRMGRRQYSASQNQADANRGPGRGQGLAQRPRNGQGHGPAMAAGRGAAMAAGRGAGRGQGIAQGKGRHNGQGPAFVDANKDGVCDNLQPSAEKK